MNEAELMIKLQKRNTIILLLLVVAVALFFLLRNKSGEIARIEKQYHKIEILDKSVKTEIAKLQTNIAQLQDSISKIDKIRKTIIIEREVDREKSSKGIADARKATEKQADSILTNRFKNSVNTLIFVATADSLTLEHHSLVELYQLQTNQLRLSGIMNIQKDSIIHKKDVLLANFDDKMDLKNEEISIIKKEKNKLIIGAGVVGILVGLLLAP